LIFKIDIQENIYLRNDQKEIFKTYRLNGQSVCFIRIAAWYNFEAKVKKSTACKFSPEQVSAAVRVFIVGGHKKL
jgi:hypothetical protein